MHPVGCVCAECEREMVSKHPVLTMPLDAPVYPQPTINVLYKGVHVPKYGTDGAAGADLYAAEKAHINAGRFEMVSTGVRIAIPPGYYGQICDRSGLAARYGLTTLAGVIDSDYRGEIKVILLNVGKEDIIINYGDRIAQIVFLPHVQAVFSNVNELPDTERGSGGFGSTGVK